MMSRSMVSRRSRSSGWIMSIARNSRRSLSIRVMNNETISAMYLLVFPLSSLMRLGLFSLILSRAAGQSNLYLATKASMLGNSSACTCLKATRYCTSSRLQAAVYSCARTQSLMYAFSRCCSVLTTAYSSAILSCFSRSLAFL
ncbi:unnamed protein product [Spodoptera exigua]|nr:unnamed protein product [Spodoptera exigua]